MNVFIVMHNSNIDENDQPDIAGVADTMAKAQALGATLERSPVWERRWGQVFANGTTGMRNWHIAIIEQPVQ